VVVYSDLFEIGGQARDPEALAFVIGHEVGHIAAGHASYWRQLLQLPMRIPFLGKALQRSMEYTADNHGYAFWPEGARRAIGVLSAGKYLLRSVDFDAMADRANSERGFFPWLANMLSSHPVHTWRPAAPRFQPREARRSSGSDRHQTGPSSRRAPIYFAHAHTPVGGNPGSSKEIAMSPRRRAWAAFAVGVLAFTAVPEVFAAIQPSGVAGADVCVNAGRRVSVSGCGNVADAVAPYVPPPVAYAPMPEDYPPPPPPPPHVNVCANVGRRVSVSGCV